MLGLVGGAPAQGWGVAAGACRVFHDSIPPKRSRLGNPPGKMCDVRQLYRLVPNGAQVRVGVLARAALHWTCLARACTRGGSRLDMAEVAPAGAKEVDQRPNTHDPFWDNQNDILKT